eukprot:Gb_16775 [translate_table: standard]
MAIDEWKATNNYYLYSMYFTFLYFTFFGMMTVGVSPKHDMATMIATPFFMLWNLFSCFMIPKRLIMWIACEHMILTWWRWYYWANLVVWTLYGLSTFQYGNVEIGLRMVDGSK